MKPTIFVYCIQLDADTCGYALAEDGVLVACHLSSSPAWSKRDLGITTECKHDLYAKHYPDGYELEWIDERDLNTHAGFKLALEHNKERYGC